MVGIKIKGTNNKVNGKNYTGEFVFEPDTIKLNEEQQAILDNYFRMIDEEKTKAENEKKKRDDVNV
ncbi:MAG: hypothetical protein ACRC5T_10630 [Cetobacterium sp.]